MTAPVVDEKAYKTAFPDMHLAPMQDAQTRRAIQAYLAQAPQPDLPPLYVHGSISTTTGDMRKPGEWETTEKTPVDLHKLIRKMEGMTIGNHLNVYEIHGIDRCIALVKELV